MRIGFITHLQRAQSRIHDLSVNLPALNGVTEKTAGQTLKDRADTNLNILRVVAPASLLTYPVEQVEKPGINCS
jgi:hypothetical protein